MSATSEPNTLTATLRGHMDKPQRVICFAFNALGNDSLILLQGSEGVFKALFLSFALTKTNLVYSLVVM